MCLAVLAFLVGVVIGFYLRDALGRRVSRVPAPGKLIFGTPRKRS